MVHKNATIKIAPIAHRIKKKRPRPHLRFVINDDCEDSLLMDFEVYGPANPENFSVKTNPRATNKKGDYYAWMEFRNCDVVYDEDTRKAIITLHGDA